VSDTDAQAHAACDRRRTYVRVVLDARHRQPRRPQKMGSQNRLARPSRQLHRFDSGRRLSDSSRFSSQFGLVYCVNGWKWPFLGVRRSSQEQEARSPKVRLTMRESAQRSSLGAPCLLRWPVDSRSRGIGGRDVGWRVLPRVEPSQPQRPASAASPQDKRRSPRGDDSQR
jgi:hypothetical protein